MDSSIVDDISRSKSISPNHVISGIYNFEAQGEKPEGLFANRGVSDFVHLAFWMIEGDLRQMKE
jgi:hypothetical protein